MEKEEPKKIAIYSYSRVWRVEKKIYAIQNLVLPVPVDPWQLLYFGITWCVFNVIFGVLPGFKSITVVIRSLLVPYLISKFLLTKKLDGKNPLRYFADIVRYLFTEQGKVLEHFVTMPAHGTTIKIKWDCSEGSHEYV